MNTNIEITTLKYTNTFQTECANTKYYDTIKNKVKLHFSFLSQIYGQFIYF